MDDQEVTRQALDYAKSNKKVIARRLTDKSIFVPEDNPVSVFMAGSPGAGKTEASIELLDMLSNNGDRVLRIDPDELRLEFEGYTGDNSYLFQAGVSVLVEKIHDMALAQSQSFVLDGTLSNFEKAKDNIKRSLKRDRQVQVLYVYQDPVLAWEFVKAREVVEGRRILPEDFISQYFMARDSVNSLKKRFEKDISVDLLLKNNDNSNRRYEANIDQIDSHVKEKYTRSDLAKIICL